MTDGATLPLFPADSRANHSVQPGSEQAQAMTATSGRRCYELFASYPRHTSWAKTYLGCFLSTGVWYSRLCALTWSVKDTTYSRSIIRLRASVPRTDEIECSLSLMPWATPTAAIAIGTDSTISKGKRDLRHDVKMWPTPTSRDHKDGTAQSCENVPVNGLLGRAVHMWPTPNAADGTGGPGNSGRMGGENLRTAVSGSLNPTWVEWLMGFPIGWTDCEHSETQ